VRTSDPVTGKPVPSPAEFYIDIDICMNCGLCAEYCPFDAIRMDHDYELASYNRLKDHIYDKERLAKPASYYAKIRPTNYAIEEKERRAKEAAKTAEK
jgi:NADH-quinone oxidoreductase subunit I